MRDELETEMHTTSGRDSRLRRFGIPILAAAAVVGLAAGGYAVLGGNDGREIAPAATRSAVTADPSPKQTPPPTTEANESKLVANPSQAYRSCIKLVRGASSIKGLAGKLAVDNGKGVTVVVANRTDAYTCNVRPDSAVSNPRPFDSAVSPEAFAVAHNATGNVLPDDPGDMAWGGGALPDGVTSISYTFPDGHQEAAVTRNGFWVMQYFSEEPFDGRPTADPIVVSLDGPGGQREVPLVWGDHTCNQVTHGC